MACSATEDCGDEADLLAAGCGGCLEVAAFGGGLILLLAGAVAAPIAPPLSMLLLAPLLAPPLLIEH